MQITDEQLMQGLNQCDCCSRIDKSEDLFWNIYWEEHTDMQQRVINRMNEQGFDAICTHCFYDLVKAKPMLMDHYLAEQERPMFYGD